MEYTTEDRQKFRSEMLKYAYDKSLIAQRIIKDAHRRAHPRSTLPPRDGICHCGDPILYDESFLRLDENGHEYHTHKSCHSWACPVCSPKLARRRANEIEQALIAANKKGYKQFFLTFTVPHRKTNTSKFVIDRLNACYNKFLKSRLICDLKKEYGFVGQIKCIDYTIGDNGLHAHLHCIWIFDTDIDELAFLQCAGPSILQKWDRIVFNESSQHINKNHGFNIEYMNLGSPDDPDAAKIARYAAKSISVYVSDGDKDKSSRTPFDLLSSKSTEEDRSLYLDFYKGQKNRRHIMFSRGLKDHLGVEDVESDVPSSAIVAGIQPEHAYFLKDENNRQEFEKIASGSVSVALEWLNRETMKQQEELARRYQDHAYRNLDLVVVPFKDAVRDIDDPFCDRAAVIAKHKEKQDRFPILLEEIREGELLKRKEAAARAVLDRRRSRRQRYSRIDFWSDEYNKRHNRRSEEPVKPSIPPSDRPLSGLGRAFAQAALYEQNRSEQMRPHGSLFFD